MIALIEKFTFAFVFIVGVTHFVGWLLGSLDLIDYYVCMKPTGQCIIAR